MISRRSFFIGLCAALAAPAPAQSIRSPEEVRYREFQLYAGGVTLVDRRYDEALHCDGVVMWLPPASAPSTLTTI